MTLQQLIRDLLKEHPKGKPQVLAKTLLGRTNRETLVKVLAEEIAHVQRHEVRSKEREAFNVLFDRVAEAPPSVSTRTETVSVSDLYRERFALGDGTQVTWGRATVEQHQQRIAMLEKLQAGIGQTIERHRKAVAAIKQAGVTCLEELEAVAAA